MARRRGIELSQVVETAAVLADHEGLENVSLARVAAALGVRSPSLYAHVDGLAGLRRALSLEAAARLGAVMDAAMADQVGIEALRALALAYRAFAHEHPGLYATLSATPSRTDDDEVFTAFAQPAAAIVDVLDTLGVPSSESIDLVRSLRSALHGFVSLEASGGFALPGEVDTSFELLVEVVIAGILSRTGASSRRRT